METLSEKDLGRYRILEQIGEGGMATVYKGMDTLLEREVAIKIIRRSALPPDQLEHILKRFEREAKTLARLSHSNIVKVYDFGDYNGSPYLVLEYLPGGTLKQRLTALNGEPIPWNEAIEILLPIAAALEFAHGQDMIHRDVKPSNILLSATGQPMLSDFGIAKLLGSEETSSLTSSGIGVGTPEYMAPEQWIGKVSAQTDLYSLGVVLYEMVTGRKPYDADTPAAILLKQATQPLPNPRKFSRNLPGGLEEVLLKALAPQPEDRYPDMRTFSQALKQLENEPKPKRRTPAVGKTIPASLEDDRTIDSPPAKKGSIKSTKTTIPIKQSKSTPVRKNSRRGLWISLASLAGIIILAFATYEFYLKNWSLPLVPASTIGTSAATAIDPVIVPTITREPTAIPPTDTPLSTATALPTPTRPQNKRTIITIENGMNLRRLTSFQSDTIDQIKWSTDNRYLIIASPSGINIYDAGDFSSVGSISPPVREVYFSNDGALVAFFATVTKMQVQNISDNTTVGIIPIPPHNGSITAVAFSQDNILLAIGMSTGTIDIYRISDKSLVASLKAPDTYVRTLAFSPIDGNELASGSGSTRNPDYSLRIWNLQMQTADHNVKAHKDPITYLFYYPDGNILVSGSKDEIYIWHVKDEIRMQQVIKPPTINFIGDYESMAFSKDGSLLAYAIPYEKGHAIILTQASDGSIVKRITNLPNTITNLDFSVDNTALASGNGTEIQIWGVP
jgi:serine/threonine protein kinase